MTPETESIIIGLLLSLMIIGLPWLFYMVTGSYLEF